MLDRLRTRTGATNVDVGLAAVVTIVGEVEVWFGSGWRGPAAVNALAVLVAADALLWRRAHTLAMLAVVVGVLVTLSLAYGGTESTALLLILLIAAYSAGAHASSLPAAVALLALGVAVHDLRDPQIKGLGDALYSWTLTALAFLVGLGMRTRQARTAAAIRDRDMRASEAVEDERRRIARELHDIVSHSLGVIVLQAGAAEQALERDPAGTREMLRSIRATGQQAIAEMGTLLSLTRGEPISSREPQPSLADLAQLVASTQDAGVSVTLRTEGEPRPLPAALELSAYRVVQEALTNAIKHAGPATIEVVVRYQPDRIDLEVKDDGARRPPGAGSRRGLAGARERVSVFGGRFEAGPRPEGGWAVRVAIPTSP